MARQGFFLALLILRLGCAVIGRVATSAHRVHDACGTEYDRNADTNDDRHTPGYFAEECADTDHGDRDGSKAFTGVAGEPVNHGTQHVTHRGVGVGCHGKFRHRDHDGGQHHHQAGLPCDA